MSQRSILVVLGTAIAVILAAVLGIAFYTGQIAKRGNRPTNTSTNQASPSPTTEARLPVSSPTPATPPTQVSANSKAYTGPGFSLQYPKTWGVLKCNNSSNFEFDPTNPADQLGVNCDFAVKPITILVSNNLQCSGESSRIGGNNIIKTKKARNGGDIDYKWCAGVGSGKVGLEVTHRVSQTGSRATSKEDFSQAIEQMISTLNFAPGGS